MTIIRGKNSIYRELPFASEAELESAIKLVSRDLFGTGRHYIDIKKKIGAKGGTRNIPDGYLLDLSSSKPQLYVVENELAAHDPLRHVAVQILEFSLSFETDHIGVKRHLQDAIGSADGLRVACEVYSKLNGFRNVDHLLERLIFEGSFAALVVIDELSEELENVLSSKFQFAVEVLELSRFVDADGNILHSFTPFLDDVTLDLRGGDTDFGLPPSRASLNEVDTIVVPSHDDGFENTFLGENRWYAVRIHGAMRPQIKFLAVYRVAPTSAITHIAPVKSIEPWKDSGKWVLNFFSPPVPIGPITLRTKEEGGRVKAPQNVRYTLKSLLDSAKTLDDIW